ncbi:hypothetical protein [Actinoplanes sp. GCM10030250]|uniref:hypothetical protein n=1 Tax=Actinoplanes sp. GCM10030250 TaxID=3273376 RepID=UPI003615959A
MSSRWYRNRYTGAAAILLAASAGAAVLAQSPGSEAQSPGPGARPPNLRTQITDRMRSTLE